MSWCERMCRQWGFILGGWGRTCTVVCGSLQFGKGCTRFQLGSCVGQQDWWRKCARQRCEWCRGLQSVCADCNCCLGWRVGLRQHGEEKHLGLGQCRWWLGRRSRLASQRQMKQIFTRNWYVKHAVEILRTEQDVSLIQVTLYMCTGSISGTGGCGTHMHELFLFCGTDHFHFVIIYS